MPNDNYFFVGDKLNLSVSFTEEAPFDSVSVYLDNVLYRAVSELPIEIEIETSSLAVGKRSVKLILDNYRETKMLSFTLFSDVKPKEYGYKLVNTYPHDPYAYTQGLIIDNGWFYEATGIKGASSVRKVKPETGEVFQSYSVDQSVFGEGITKFGDKLIQLSWQAHTGYVYDFETFKLQRKFSYSTEGWGITHNGEHLIMSDGSEVLYFLDPESFALVKKLQVYANTGPYKRLNELEYINGSIYANVYQTDKIVIIDPENGKITGIINCKGIIDKSKYPGIDVLNGIAYDAAADRLFVTGKLWPFMYEIEIK